MDFEYRLSQLRDAAAPAVQATFEEMAFLDTEPIEKPENPPAHTSILVIEIHEPCHGTLALFLPKTCKEKIVENIFGGSLETLTSKQIDDCLLELLNVLAGNFMTVYFGEELTYRLGFPKILFDDQSFRSPSSSHSVESWFSAEDISFRLSICLETLREESNDG